MNNCQSCGKVRPITEQLKKEKAKQQQIRQQLKSLEQSHEKRVTKLKDKIVKSQLKVRKLKTNKNKSVPRTKTSNYKVNIQKEIDKNWTNKGDIQTVELYYNQERVQKLVEILKKNKEFELADDIQGWFDCYTNEKNNYDLSIRIALYKKTQNMLAQRGFSIPCANILQEYEKHNEDTCFGYCFCSYSEMSDSDSEYPF
jgi:hypothetical protein